MNGTFTDQELDTMIRNAAETPIPECLLPENMAAKLREYQAQNKEQTRKIEKRSSHIKYLAIAACIVLVVAAEIRFGYSRHLLHELLERDTSSCAPKPEVSCAEDSSASPMIEGAESLVWSGNHVYYLRDGKFCHRTYNEETAAYDAEYTVDIGGDDMTAAALQLINEQIVLTTVRNNADGKTETYVSIYAFDENGCNLLSRTLQE